MQKISEILRSTPEDEFMEPEDDFFDEQMIHGCALGVTYKKMGGDVSMIERIGLERTRGDGEGVINRCSHEEIYNTIMSNTATNRSELEKISLAFEGVLDVFGFDSGLTDNPHHSKSIAINNAIYMAEKLGV